MYSPTAASCTLITSLVSLFTTNATRCKLSVFSIEPGIEILNVSNILDTCSGNVNSEIKIKNNGSNILTSLPIGYSVNGETEQTYNWTGTVNPLESQTVLIEGITFNLADNNTLNISLVDDEVSGNNTGTVSFGRAIESTSTHLTLDINTDSWGYECHWNITDSSGVIVEESVGTYGNNTTINLNLSLGQDCYKFNLTDDYGDGGNTVTLKDNANNIIFSASGNYGTGVEKMFSTENAPLAVNTEILNLINVYPNPAKNQFTISNAESFNVKLYSILGKEILTKLNMTNSELINTSNLTSGTYFVKIYSDNSSKTEKLVIIK